MKVRAPRLFANMAWLRQGIGNRVRKIGACPCRSLKPGANCIDRVSRSFRLIAGIGVIPA